jgi:asparagine synthase (glutamine-hydrolysing)
MCGINGIVSYRSPVDPQRLCQMREALIHRGPDDAGVWMRAKGPPFVGFGHRRLSIIDLSEAGRQPMSYNEGNLVVVYNGELYNYIELRNELKGLGCAFGTQSDTEVLLAAFYQWGEDCLNRLNGMFAFAIWDERKRRLFAARDRFGKKPFFYHFKNGQFYFASEMKALFRHPEIRCLADPGELESYADAFQTENGDRTMFEGIFRLKPSEALVLGVDGGLKRWQYWGLEKKVGANESNLEDAVAKFRELFTDSVKIRLRADVPLGSSLSGGLDSSAIVCTLANELKSQDNSGLKTFSARFPNSPTFDEGEYIDAVVDASDAQAYQTTPSPDDLIEHIRQIHYYQEEPFVSSSIFAQWKVMQLAKEQGVTILLDGQGGDEILAGYIPYFSSYFMDLLLKHRLGTLALELGSFLLLQYKTIRKYEDASQRFHVLGPSTLSNFWKARRRYGGRRQRRRGEASGAQFTCPSPFEDRLSRHLHRDLVEVRIPQLLRYADRNAMAFSREVRNPFLDHRLVEFLFSLPSHYKIRHGWNKFILRQAMSGIIPRKVINRFDKVGYITPETQWLRGPLKEWAQDILFGKKLREVRSYPEVEVRLYWQEHQSGKGDYRWRIWPWISLSVWLSMIEDGSFSSGNVSFC